MLVISAAFFGEFVLLINLNEGLITNVLSA